jgi:hypothetical protein
MEDTFPSLVERRLNSHADGLTYRHTEILNFAIPGDSILRRFTRFQRKALEFDIDAVVDISVSGEGHLAVRNLRDAVLERTPDLAPELLNIIRRAAVSAEMPSDAIDSRLGPFSNEILSYGYRQLAVSARQNDVAAVVIMLPRLDDTDEVFRDEWELISALADEAGLDAIGLQGVYGPLNDRNTLKLASWDWHPNAEGHALLADRIYREFQRIDFLATKPRVGESKTSGLGSDIQ